MQFADGQLRVSTVAGNAPCRLGSNDSRPERSFGRVSDADLCSREQGELASEQGGHVLVQAFKSGSTTGVMCGVVETHPGSAQPRSAFELLSYIPIQLRVVKCLCKRSLGGVTGRGEHLSPSTRGPLFPFHNIQFSPSPLARAQTNLAAKHLEIEVSRAFSIGLG